ncbi:MAG: LysM peptidoglycan-binding domain-containing protein [Caldilineaceae bacterium]|nr:LysM peptidoglycan-binding domain-containing protein [Caldilineaceae bacterium]
MARQFLRFVLSLFLPVGGVLWLAVDHALYARPAQQTESPVIVAAGDAANCSNWQDEATAQLIDAIDGPVLMLGDGAEQAGLLWEYEECYGPTWGRFKDRTYPVPGNREYGSGNPVGYFTYWGERATPLEPGCTNECKGYYSFNVGAWHIVALNTEAPYDVGSDQEQWLRADLAAHPTQCTLAYFHRPLFSSGRQFGSGLPLWQALYDYGADVVLNGHEHMYERFAPQSPSGEYQPERGIRQFTVGTGGHRHRDFVFIQPNSEARNSETFGVLKLTLHPTSYDWEFIPIAGQSFTDAGSGSCVSASELPPGAASPASAPAAPAVTTTPATTAVANVAMTTSPAAPSTTAPTLPAGGQDYVVQVGDTISLIAARYGLDWRQLAAANQLSNPDRIEVGQVIRLPGVQGATQPVTGTAPIAATGITATTTVSVPGVTAVASAPATTAGARVHTVVAGDTIIGIAARYGLNWRQLLQINGLQEDTVIRVGQQIRLE